jgi:rhodanese-related sulfurtransferase
MRIKTLGLVLIPVALLATMITSVFAQSSGPVQKISFEVFEEKLKQASPNPQILDTRSAEEFDLDHLIGAVNVTVDDETELQKQFLTLDKKKPVFVYSINNGRSGRVAKKLKSQNFNEVYELPGGISKWIGAGRPVESKTGIGLTTVEYNKLIRSDKLVLVDIHSKFCGSCKKLSPIVDSIAHANPNRVKLVKVELFDNKLLGKDFNIEAVPTLILYKDAKVIWRKSGFTSGKAIDEIISAQL